MLLAGYDAARIQSRFFAPIEKLAAYVNGLPATPCGNYSGEGGLLQVAVEMAFWSYHAADSKRFYTQQ